VVAAADDSDIIIKAAAVADYRPTHVAGEKLKKKDGEMSIELERTDDILVHLGKNKKPGQFLCGFSMETKDLISNSREKLVKKNLDMIAANNLRTAGAGFGTDTNVLTLITRDGELPLELMAKEEAASVILDEILKERRHR
jgi:phosphopantothenoylcysteine decarboxylase/phosphopantothenate--cysteine ligase